MRYFIFVIIMTLLLCVMQLSFDNALANAHGTHSGTGEVIATGSKGFTKLLQITAGARDDDGNLLCDHVRQVMFVWHIEDGESVDPCVHLLKIYECSEWDRLIESSE